MEQRRIFLLSPASSSGKRAALLFNDRAEFDIAKRVRAQPVDESRYRYPLERDARKIAERIGPRCQVVLLGSIATGKYVDVLSPIFGDRLRFPKEFLGHGDMARGGMLLERAASGIELTYLPVSVPSRLGVRATKKSRLRSPASASP